MEFLTGSMCRSCRTRLSTSNTSRAFSTSIRNRTIPPESPAYIDIPSTYQPDTPYIRPQKGILPVPRELFPKNRPDKPSQQYLDNLIKSPLPKNEVSYESLSELGKYRYRMSQLRKKHIKEGLTELHKRKVETTTKMEYRSSARQRERARLLEQLPREDARLTNSSVPTVMQLKKSATPIADNLAVAKAMYEKKVANYNATVAAKNEERMDALHTLYMNAREFITTEEQLNATIDKVFDGASAFGNDERMDHKSMWEKSGTPDTIRDMIANSQIRHDRSSSSQMVRSVMQQKTDGAATLRFLRDQERMQKIAEKLSGGKI